MSFALLSSTRYDPFLISCPWNNDPDGPSPYFLLHYQADRLIRSAALHDQVFQEGTTLSKVKTVCDKAVQEHNDSRGETPLKLRVVLDPSGELSATASPAKEFESDPTLPSLFNPATDSPPALVLTIHIDTQPTSDTTSLKTTDRRAYDDARVRAGLQPVGSLDPPASHAPDDVILYNTRNIVTESSVCNVAFYRNGRWVTPPLAAGCISGVLRRWLIEQHRIFEAAEDEFTIDGIKDGEWVLVSNGVFGCKLGRIKLHTSDKMD
ncbi:aminotransferase [Suillus clintonianus]|uniref:aminotransferase n=1 Tax=Suillus clintonianus TaxID=1904413 RepID=UPI001B85DE9D|nr:aminotransferase [Suillus clintonianus]KAG2154551.1 aminotransferase [Suillus clintonianus]